jgi:hypothetical protein
MRRFLPHQTADQNKIGDLRTYTRGRSLRASFYDSGTLCAISDCPTILQEITATHMASPVSTAGPSFG